MSHNLYTLNSVAGNVFSYHGSNKGIIYLGRGESANYAGTSPSTITTANDYEFYDTNPINTISGATFTAGSASNWYKAFTLPAGTYEISLSLSAETTTFSGLQLWMYEGASFNGNCIVQILNPTGIASTTNPPVGNVCKIFQYASTTTIKWIAYRNTGDTATTQLDPNNVLSSSTFLFIRKLA